MVIRRHPDGSAVPAATGRLPLVTTDGPDAVSAPATTGTVAKVVPSVFTTRAELTVRDPVAIALT